jgi:hypothetical protein
MFFCIELPGVHPCAILVPRLIAKGIRVRNVIMFLFQTLQLPIRTGVVRRDA